MSDNRPKIETKVSRPKEQAGLTTGHLKPSPKPAPASPKPSTTSKK